MPKFPKTLAFNQDQRDRLNVEVIYNKIYKNRL